jgi:hypothetical protein
MRLKYRNLLSAKQNIWTPLFNIMHTLNTYNIHTHMHACMHAYKHTKYRMQNGLPRACITKIPEGHARKSLAAFAA